ncbi:MAG: dephospho-CoA kinase [Rhodospirillales bacterium]|nr:dephospho-CoA kinase [Rhodospirillales bacterium]
MRVIGLTGGIGMGKSAAAAMLRRLGLPVFDADAAVHRLQAPGGAALPAIGRAFPGTVRGGRLDRAALRAAVFGHPAALRRLESILHPLVRAAERRFIARARAHGHRLVVLDIPLLFETGGEDRADIVIVVSAPPSVQRQRVRARGRSDAEIDAILARQMPDAEKRRRADHVIRTGLSRHHSQRHLRRLVQHWRKEKP